MNRFALGCVALALPQLAGAATPNDPLWYAQWNLNAIGAEAAWEVSSGSGVRIAVIDTGVKSDHPDGPASLRMDLSWDFVNQDAFAEDGNGYGTAIAGIIGAQRNNGVGIAGLASGAEILPIQVLSDQGAGSFAAVYVGIDWAVANGADIIVLALGQPDSPVESPGPRAVRAAIDRATAAGVLTVVAAGDHGGEVFFPASMDSVVAVGAVNQSLQVPYFSARGPALDIVAPGTSIPTLSLNGGYQAVSGTAFAAGQVAAGAALLWSLEPSATAESIRERLLDTATDLGAPGPDNLTGYGLLNLGDLVNTATCEAAEEALAACEADLGNCEGDLDECYADLDDAQADADQLAAELIVAEQARAEAEQSLIQCDSDLDDALTLLSAVQEDYAAALIALEICEQERDDTASDLEACQATLGDQELLISSLQLDLEACMDSAAICAMDLADAEEALAQASLCLTAAARLAALPPGRRPRNPWGYTTGTFDGYPECDLVITELIRHEQRDDDSRDDSSRDDDSRSRGQTRSGRGR